MNAEASKGNRADRLFRMYHSRLLAYATRICGKRDVAEDVVGDVWEVVVRSGAATAVGADEQLFGWLAGIARHRLWATYRLHAREIPVEVIGETRADVDQAPAPYVFHAQLPEYLAEAVASLPPAQRSAMETVADGIPAPAAASWLGKTADAVRCNRRHAALRLRPQLAALAGGAR